MTYYKGQLHYIDQTVQYLIWYLAKEFDQVNNLRKKHNLTLKQTFIHMKLQGYLGTFMFTDNTSTHLYGAIQYYDEKHIRLILSTNIKKPIVNDVLPATYHALYDIYAKDQRDLLLYQIYDELNNNKHLYLTKLDYKNFISKSTSISALMPYIKQLNLQKSRKRAYKTSQIERANFYKIYHNLRLSEYQERKKLPIKKLLKILDQHTRCKQAYQASQHARKQWYMLYHKARYQRYQQAQTALSNKKQVLANRIKNQIKAIYYPKQIKTQYRINTHNYRYSRAKKQTLTKLTTSLQTQANKLEWLTQQKQKLKPFPIDSYNSGLNFENLNLFNNQHKIIYLFLGQDKSNEFIAKVGRSINLSGREYLYTKTVLGSKDNLFKPNQTILLTNYFIDDQDTWTTKQFYALEAFYIHQFQINNCIKKPREWLCANSKQARNKLQNIFNNTTKIITEHPELLTYFDIRSQGRYGTSNLRHDLNKYSLTELLSLTNKYNNYAN